MLRESSKLSVVLDTLMQYVLNLRSQYDSSPRTLALVGLAGFVADVAASEYQAHKKEDN